VSVRLSQSYGNKVQAPSPALGSIKTPLLTCPGTLPFDATAVPLNCTSPHSRAPQHQSSLSRCCSPPAQTHPLSPEGPNTSILSPVSPRNLESSACYPILEIVNTADEHDQTNRVITEASRRRCAHEERPVPRWWTTRVRRGCAEGNTESKVEGNHRVLLRFNVSRNTNLISDNRHVVVVGQESVRRMPSKKGQM
jgi:hypothetical protein